jgi:hypothetical protein
MKNIFVLHTADPTRLMRMFDHGRDELELSLQCCEWQYGVHVNITSNEKVKEGDWCLDKITLKVFKYGSGLANGQTNLPNATLKIVLTTDSDLIIDGVQEIDNIFLEWFIDNPTCEFVKVTKLDYLSNNQYRIYDVPF